MRTFAALTLCLILATPMGLAQVTPKDLVPDTDVTAPPLTPLSITVTFSKGKVATSIPPGWDCQETTWTYTDGETLRYDCTRPNAPGACGPLHINMVSSNGHGVVGTFCGGGAIRCIVVGKGCVDTYAGIPEGTPPWSCVVSYAYASQGSASCTMAQIYHPLDFRADELIHGL